MIPLTAFHEDTNHTKAMGFRRVADSLASTALFESGTLAEVNRAIVETIQTYATSSQELKLDLAIPKLPTSVKNACGASQTRATFSWSILTKF
jgi:hypothetical protein